MSNDTLMSGEPRIHAGSSGNLLGSNVNSAAAVVSVSMEGVPHGKTAGRTLEADSYANVNDKILTDSSVEHVASDRWSNRGVSSKVSITIDTEEVANYANERDAQKKHTNCFTRCVKKLVGNVLLPGLVGIYKYRQIDKLPHKHPISKQLMTNSLYYCTRIRTFLRHDLLPEIKLLATEIYFPTGQIEADGLSRISAEIWSATYLLLSIHKHVREADYHNIRSAFTSLAWDSAQTYRSTLKFHRCLETFRSKILPLWFEIEDVTGLDLKNDFSAIDHPSRPNVKKRKQKRHMKDGDPLPTPLSTIQVHDDFILQNTLSMHLLREKKSTQLLEDEEESHQREEERAFSNLGYGKQIDVIKSILGKPIDALQNAPAVFRLIEPRLLSESLGKPEPAVADMKDAEDDAARRDDDDLTCARALKILSATLKILFEEVDMLPSVRNDIEDAVSSLGEELNDFLGYADWVANKFSEFHSMLRLCYNFAQMCFDMDLPSFESVVKQELATEDIYALSLKSRHRMLGSSSSTSSSSHHDLDRDRDRVEFKVASLTKMMMAVSASSAGFSPKAQIDDEFDWQDFYKTQYHGVLQRLPLRVGSHLVQFSAKHEVLLIVRRRAELAGDELQRFPGSSGGSFANVKKLDQ